MLGGIGIGGMLIFGLRFLPGLLPELFGLAGVVITALIARAVRNRPSGGFSSPGGGGSAPRSAPPSSRPGSIMRTGDVGGTVLSGRFPGRTLDSLGDSELLDLHARMLRPTPIRCGSSNPISTGGWAPTGARRASRRAGRAAT